jgi:hypothetical protein
MILALPEDGQMVLRFDIGVSKADAMNALIDGGSARQQAVDREPAKVQSQDSHPSPPQ